MATATRVATAVALLLPLTAFGGTATVSWGEVTQREDGTPVEISDYRVYYGTEPVTKDSPFVHVQGGLSHQFVELSAATWYFAATALDSTGLESDLSASVSKTIQAVEPPPAAPDGLTVQDGALTAYTLVQSADRLVLVPVGTAPAGTPCENTVVRDANGVVGYLIPKGSVAYSGTVRPQVVVAQCGP
jgi:hypothetical protein